MTIPFALDPYQQACDNAAFFDLAEHARLEVTGKDAAAFLHNLCTNDITRLVPGQGCEAFFTNAKARVLAHVWVRCAEQAGDGTSYWLQAAAGLGETLRKHLDHYLISEDAEIVDRTQEVSELHIAGPRAEAVVTAARAERGWHVCRHDRVALPGFDVLVPAPEALAVRRAIEQAGAVLASPDVFEVLRIEAGVPAAGAEIDDTRLAMELGRTSQAICYTKGCYLGQETIVMARDRGHVNRTLLGLTLAGSEPIPTGTKVLRETEEVGQVTSSTFSPRVGRTIALAFLRRGCQEPGTDVTVETESGMRSAKVATLPFIP